MFRGCVAEQQRSEAVVILPGQPRRYGERGFAKSRFVRPVLGSFPVLGSCPLAGWCAARHVFASFCYPGSAPQVWVERFGMEFCR